MYKVILPHEIEILLLSYITIFIHQISCNWFLKWLLDAALLRLDNNGDIINKDYLSVFVTALFIH